MTLTGVGGDAKINAVGYPVTISGVLSGPGGLEKRGTNVMTLSANNIYGGPTTVTAGMLTLSSTGAISNSNFISVASGAILNVAAVTGGWNLGTGQTLKGSGTVLGNVTILGIHAPGNSPGTETMKGNYNMQGQLQIELKGISAGTGYDQVLLPLSGSTAYKSTLGGTLSLDWSSLSGSTDTTQLWILKNDTPGTLSGEFSNYVNGASLGVHDGREWFLWYRADAATGNLSGGNDVLVTTIPEPAGMVMLGIAACGAVLAARRWRRG
jgi:autotransporter-associated beta strand protein